MNGSDRWLKGAVSGGEERSQVEGAVIPGERERSQMEESDLRWRAQVKAS